MATNKILAFAQDPGANVITDAEYAALTALLADGFLAGIAHSGQMNKVWRQTSVMAAALAQFMADNQATNIDDSLTVANLATYLKTAINSAGSSDSRLSKDVAGGVDVTLTSIEALNGILNFTGLLTANINVIVPAVPRRWLVTNNTTGSFTLTVKTSGGTGYIIPQGIPSLVFCDGTNVDLQNELGATPSQFDNTTKLATTEFVRNSGWQFGNLVSLSTSRNLLATDIGKILLFNAASLTLTMPTPTSLSIPIGGTVEVASYTGTDGTIAFSGSTYTYGASGISTNLSVKAGETLALTAVTANVWLVTAGTAELGKTASFGSSLATAGYQKLPSGLIIQWGNFNGTAGASGTYTFPIAFPTACVGIGFGGLSPTGASAPYMTALSASQFSWNRGSSVATNGYFVAVGY